MAKGRIYTYAIKDESGVYKIPYGSIIRGFTNPEDAKKELKQNSQKEIMSS